MNHSSLLRRAEARTVPTVTIDNGNTVFLTLHRSRIYIPLFKE